VYGSERLLYIGAGNRQVEHEDQDHDGKNQGSDGAFITSSDILVTTEWRRAVPMVNSLLSGRSSNQSGRETDS
jgi:hypothetical protein